ncbi:glycosyltransferase [Cellulosimicrobium arenosum]|uniref:Glycosyltransferase n=1 Tax=Cellulosimicrobium arenosum TaxID=2708133 RepID=A0A927G8L1_9MICO|nr:glycosyltransferase [Cellulosimicrobium arenosum]MBD8078947.1 glycosyltransferase [Cellulosimicrobium arenosum]
MNEPTTFVLPADEPFVRQGAGAVARVTAHLASGLQGWGRPVQVVSPRLDGPVLLDDVPVTATAWGPSASLPVRVARRLARVVRRSPVDPHHRYREQVIAVAPPGTLVVHNDARLAQMLAARGRNVLLWLHNLVVDDAVAEAAHACRLVAVSDYVRHWTFERHGVPLDRIDVVPNGVDLDLFHPRSGEREDGPLRVVLHARIDPNKGQLVAARAVASLRARGVPVDLAVAGALRTFGMDPARVVTYRAELTAAIRSAGGRLLGEVPHDAVPGLLRDHDVALALTSVPEPFSLAALEAMATGCAVVAVPAGGLAEVVGDAARLVEPSVGEVAEAIAELAKDPALRADLGRRARKRAEAFGWEASVAALVRVLDAEGGVRAA